MHWERTVRRQTRRSADIIGVTILARLAINYLLYPLMWLLPDFADGTAGGELIDIILYVIVFAIPFAVGSRLSGMTVQDLVGVKRPEPGVYFMAIGLVLGWSYLVAAGCCLGAVVLAIVGLCGCRRISNKYGRVGSIMLFAFAAAAALLFGIIVVAIGMR